MGDAFAEDMAEMVRVSGATEAEKSLAMAYVRATGKIANGHKGNPDAMCDAMIAQTPILLEMYLARRVTRKDVEDCVARHVSDCPAGAAMRLRKGDRDDSGSGVDCGVGVGLGGFNWPRFAFALVAKGGWPGAVVVLGFYYKDLIEQLVLR